jgi:hypothetical protein
LDQSFAGQCAVQSSCTCMHTRRNTGCRSSAWTGPCTKRTRSHMATRWGAQRELYGSRGDTNPPYKLALLLSTELQCGPTWHRAHHSLHGYCAPYTWESILWGVLVFAYGRWWPNWKSFMRVPGLKGGSRDAGGCMHIQGSPRALINNQN